MSIDQLKQELATFSEDGVGAEFYFIINNNGNAIVKSADIDVDAQTKLKRQFTHHIRETIIENEELSLLDISAADERQNVIYKYDLDEIPEELNVLDTILGDQELPRFSFRTDSMSDIKGILIRVGADDEQIALYKKNYPISLIQKENPKTFMLRRNDHRFVELDSDVLKINPKFEFFKLNGELYVIDLQLLEKSFGFSEIIMREAQRGVETIRESGLLENPEFLEEQLSDVSFSKKLTRVLATSPVLNIIPNKAVIEFVENHPLLRGKLKVNENRTKLLLHTKKSRILLIKLLNDDYLISQLTHKNYESLAKDSVEE